MLGIAERLFASITTVPPFRLIVPAWSVVVKKRAQGKVIRVRKWAHPSALIHNSFDEILVMSVECGLAFGVRYWMD